MEKKIVTIGGGPGGYAAAIRAAQLGAQVTLAEERELGGTCLNAGCIPTKALLHTSALFSKIKSGSVRGVVARAVSIDWQDTQMQKAQIVARLVGGIDALLRHNGVQVSREHASLLSGGRVKIGAEEVAADAVILATGSVSAALDFPGCELEGVIDSAAALALEEIPKSIAIVGGGAIGIEFATLFSQLGAKVTVLEALSQILPPFDSDVSAYLREALEASGVGIHTSAALRDVAKTQSGLLVRFDEGGAQRSVVGDRVLIAVGRRPNTAALALKALGVRMAGGAIAVDEHFCTNLPGLYAVGDCNGQNMLAHAAMAQGVAAAEHIMGAPTHYNPKVVPSCVYSSPEIACVGMTEKQIQGAGIAYSVGTCSLAGNGKSLIDDEGGGFVKILADSALGEVLGAHIVAPRATEMIAEAALCMSMEGTVQDLADTIHAHPTVSEAVGEAAMSVFGRPIHEI